MCISGFPHCGFFGVAFLFHDRQLAYVKNHSNATDLTGSKAVGAASSASTTTQLKTDAQLTNISKLFFVLAFSFALYVLERHLTALLVIHNVKEQAGRYLKTSLT